MQRVGDVDVLSSRQLHSVSVVRTRLALRDVSLYVQKDVQGLPLPETAECLAADALLRICGLRFDLCEKHNVEYMSPSGRAPFVKCGADIVSELEPIARYLSGRGVPACSRGEGADGPRLRALLALLQYSLSAAELRVCWLHDATRRCLTEPRLSQRYPWPLCRFVAFQKRRRALQWLNALNGTREGTDFCLEHLYRQVDRVCSALSSQLGEEEFFFGDGATQLEAMVYGHLYLLLTVPVPLGEAPLAKVVGQYPNLLSLVSRMDQELFNRSTAFWVVERPEVLLPVLMPSTESLSVTRSDASTCTRDDSDEEPLERRYCAVCMVTLSDGEPSTEQLAVTTSDASTSTRDETDMQSEAQSSTGVPRTDRFTTVRRKTAGVDVQPSRQFYSIEEVGRREAEVDLKLATLLQLTAALLLLYALTTLERLV